MVYHKKERMNTIWNHDNIIQELDSQVHHNINLSKTKCHVTIII